MAIVSTSTKGRPVLLVRRTNKRDLYHDSIFRGKGLFYYEKLGGCKMDANPATSHMFIVNPLSGGGILKLFSTHPSIEKRITRLESMRSGG